MFNNKAELIEEEWDDVVTTKEICVWFLITFFLINKKYIIYKWKSRNWNKREKRFSSFLENIKNKCDVNSRKNGRKSKTLSYIYIGFEKRGNKTIPYILHLSVN